MTCVICRQADAQPGTTTVTLEREKSTLVIKGVPATVCPNCGEAYVAEEVTERLLRTAEKAARAGAQLEIRQYEAA